ncbi:hypothetical protein [Stigmatella erecta]|uniref:Lipoprotein MlpA n=1 Tax=Stigmatella erecta TaxID=83460 RepID=A0A1I0JZJ7_9BACT|nr:hypothetical protein [Stigmatella erecta]SEU15709.1 hypothetical protein SAMN05443639_108234 [Stigmatella erecta]
MGTKKVMIKNIVSTVTALAGMSLLLTGCDQPSAGCVVQDSTSWYARYDVKEGQNISEACAALIPLGEPVGVFKYVNPDVENSAVLALRPNALASRSRLDPTVNVPAEGVYPQTAIGSLVAEPDGDDLCGTSNWSAASVNASASGTTPATQISYTYSNVRVVARPDAPGTQMGGDITFTRTQGELTCTAQLTMRAIWPAIPCDPTDANSCGPEHNINPIFDVVCDPDVNFCVPRKEVPSFK